MAKEKEKKELDKPKGKPESEEEGEEQTQAPPAGGSKKKLLIIGAAVVGLLVLVGFPVMFFTLRGGEKKASPEMQTAAEEGQPKPGGEAVVAEGSTDEDQMQENEEALGALFPFDTFVVNLKGGKYLRAQIQVEFVERDVPRRFYSRLVPTRDGLITLLTTKTADDVNSSEGKEALKREVKDLINEVLRKEEVKNVYFTQFVLQ